MSAGTLRWSARIAACAMAGTLLACGTGSGGVSPGDARIRGSNDIASGNREELRTASDQTKSEKRAETWLQLAIEYYQNAQYETALDEIKKALGANPEMADAYMMRGLIYSAMGNQVALADENFQRALRLSPSNPDMSNNYGSFLCQNGHPDKGITYLETALRNPRYQSPINALVNAGSCSIRLKQFDQAERYLLEAQSRNEDLPIINVNLARLYHARRDYARAAVYFNRGKTGAKLDKMPAELLWLGIRIDHKLGETASETSMATQLRRHHPGSAEYAAYRRGAFDE